MSSGFVVLHLVSQAVVHGCSGAAPRLRCVLGIAPPSPPCAQAISVVSVEGEECASTQARAEEENLALPFAPQPC